MDFIGNKEAQIKEMLQVLGLSDVMELFQDVPSQLILKGVKHDDGISEYEGIRHLEKLADKNTFCHYESYLGAGAYEHHIPAIVPAICGKSEFLTSYTPYQAEASQGTLQAIFEFQSAICALTEMDVANASVYDGASACAEALLMALRCRPERHKVIVAESLHPHYLEVIKVYLDRENIQVELVPFSDDEGLLDFESLEKLLDANTAGILIPYPNFFGCIEDIKSVVQLAKKNDSLTILCANPLVYGLYASAGELDVDIAVGDCQPLGIPLQFGGPYAGYMACKDNYLRQLPGRIVGKTVDREGKDGFVLTLQAREQHIRREKATSNICTNQTLASIASLISLLWYGKEGIKKLSAANFTRASYLREQLLEIPGIAPFGTSDIFNEFCLKLSFPIDKVLKHFKDENIIAGIDVGNFFPKYHNVLLIAVTETKSKKQLDDYVAVMQSFSHSYNSGERNAKEG